MENLIYARITTKELQTFVIKIQTMFLNSELSEDALGDIEFILSPFYDRVIAYEKAGSERQNNVEYTAEEKKELDNKRDATFGGLKGLATTFQNSSDPIQVAVAEKLERVIRKHGWTLDKEPYAKQSAGTRNLLAEIEKVFTAEELQAIYADSWVANLKTEQQAFEDYALNLNKGRAGKGVSQSDLKREMFVATDELLNYLPYLNKKVSDENINPLINNINKLIIDTNAIIKSRETKLGEKKSKDEDETEAK